MRRPAMDFLTVTENLQIDADVAALLDDTHLSAAVTYRDFQSVTFTPSTGAKTPVYTDFSLRAIRNTLPSGEVRAAEGLYQMGDVRFLFARSDLTVTPAKDDVIVHAGETYNIVAWDTDPLGKLWRLVARKVT